MASYLQPAWALPAGVSALMSLRAGGVSAAPYNGFNLSLGVGDAPAAVMSNRAEWARRIAARPTWLRQVHGTAVLQITRQTPEHPPEAADAAWTRERGIACMVGAADCMPVLMASHDGSVVAAAHAGWRGLALGVLESTIQALQEGAGVRAHELAVWLGPCIGPRQFEVGPDVLEAFGQSPSAPDPRHFVGRVRPDGSAAWLANLPQLAQDRLRAAGVRDITDAAMCTVEDPSRFFSFRRDRITGRMVAAIWLT